MLPVSHKLTKTTQFFQDHDHSPHLWWSGCNWSDDRGPWEGQLRSHEGIIRVSPITRDRMEMETRKWCQTAWLVKPLWKICILTYLGHDLTLTCPDLRSDFEIDLSRSKRICPESARRGEHDGVIFIFISLLSKSFQWKTISVNNDNFSFDYHWSQNCWP